MKYLYLYENFKTICKCGWSWKVEKSDDRPYWCHKCGYDNTDGKYYMEDLKSWKKENNIKD